MREVKFRAWDEYKKKLVINILTIKINRTTQKPGLIIYTDKKINEHHEIKEIDKIYCNQFKLMQFINRKDMNGNEVFEDDLLSTKERDMVFQVVWDSEDCAFKFKSSYTDTLFEIDRSLRKLEIIGNIHDEVKNEH